jgi:predicted small lipoprotein YifL
MILRLLLILGISVAVVSCGIKNDLVLPNGKETPKTEKDPSKPPQPVGR